MSGADELLTVQEISDELKVNPQTVRNWIDRGELKALRVGARRVRVTRQALNEFIGVRDEAAAAPSNRRRIEALEREIATLASEVRRLADELERIQPHPGSQTA